MPDPRISVVVPNYNHAQYLPRSLGALLDQPVLPCEIIVVDDASTDNSVDVVETFIRRHPIIRLLRNDRNLHIARTLTRGLEITTGEYVFFSSADDEVMSGIFEHAANLIRTYPDAGVYSGVGEFRDEQTGLKWYYGGGMPKRPCYLTPQDMVRLGRKSQLHICSYNAIYRKSALIGAGGWITELGPGIDWFANHVVGFRHGMCHTPEILSVAHVYPTSYSQRPHRTAKTGHHSDPILTLLNSPPYADVMPLIRKSGVLGYHGWNFFLKVISQRQNWAILNWAYLWQLSRRMGETLGRRFLPKWLARLCVRCFYGPGS